MKAIRNIFIVILFTLILTEAILQVSYHMAPNLIGVIQKVKTLSGPNPFAGYYDSGYWKRRFIEQYRQDKFKNHALMQGTHLPHKTRGWTPKPNISVIKEGHRYTTNNLGHRAIKDYAYDTGQYQVLIVGDSYSFGIDADDSCVWPTMLQAFDERLNVVNLAVGGYGIDQMYITLRETIRFYKPNLVIVAFIGENIWRAMLDFRDYKKPKFEIQGEALVLTNTPIGSLEEVYKETVQEVGQKGFDLKYLRIDDLINNLYATIRSRSVGEATDEARRFEKIFEHMHETAERAGAEFLVVYLSSGPEIWDQEYHSPGEGAFLGFVKKSGVKHINTRPYFLQTDGYYSSGHYRAAEARLVSTLVYDEIKRLASWGKFVKTRYELERRN